MIINSYAEGYGFELQSGDRMYCVKIIVNFLVLFRKMFVIVLAHECFLRHFVFIFALIAI